MGPWVLLQNSPTIPTPLKPPSFNLLISVYTENLGRFRAPLKPWSLTRPHLGPITPFLECGEGPPRLSWGGAGLLGSQEDWEDEKGAENWSACAHMYAYTLMFLQK